MRPEDVDPADHAAGVGVCHGPGWRLHACPHIEARLVRSDGAGAARQRRIGGWIEGVWAQPHDHRYDVFFTAAGLVPPCRRHPDDPAYEDPRGGAPHGR